MMRFYGIHASLAVFALALGVMLVGQAHASCSDDGDRIDYEDAECLAAEWNNYLGFTPALIAVKNKCSDLGKVVARIDIWGHPGYTIHLTDGLWVENSPGFTYIQDIYCCTDLSDLCNKSDLDED